MSFKRVITAVSAAAFAIALGACSNGDEPTGSEQPDTSGGETTGQTDGDFPVTVSHVFGETIIESQPERVATIQWSNQDVALALGVVPVGMAFQTWGVEDDSGILAWTQEALDELGAETPVLYSEADGLDFEAIADSNPDVILAAYSGITQEDYETLSQIAPTIAYPEIPWSTTWREAIQLNSQALGLAAEGDDLIADLEGQIAGAVAAHPAIEGKSAAFVYVDITNLSSLAIYTLADPRAAYLTDLGLEVPGVVSEAGDDQFFFDVSAETVDSLNDIDILVLYTDEAGYAQLKADPLLGQISAVQRDSVVLIGGDGAFPASTNPTALAIPWGLDEYITQISEAAQNVQ